MSVNFNHVSTNEEGRGKGELSLRRENTCRNLLKNFSWEGFGISESQGFEILEQRRTKKTWSRIC